jgi:hypothetical protein
VINFLFVKGMSERTFHICEDTLLAQGCVQFCVECVSQVCLFGIVILAPLRVVNLSGLSLIATCVFLASSVYVGVCPGR